MRINVVLPAPFGPSRPTISPRSTSNDTSSSAGRTSPPRADPYRFVTPRTLIKPGERLLQTAIAQGPVVLAPQVTDLVQQRTRDRLVQFPDVVDRPEQVPPIKDDGPFARVALEAAWRLRGRGRMRQRLRRAAGAHRLRTTLPRAARRRRRDHPIGVIQRQP